MHALQFSRLFSSTFTWAHGQRAQRQLAPAPAPLMSGKSVRPAERRTINLAGPADHASQQQAVEAERTKVFMATLAHELRNTMAPLGNALEILGSDGCSPQLAARALPMAQRQLQHMSYLVDELLDMGRVLNDCIDLDLNRSRLQELVCNAVQASAPAAEARQHQIHLDLPAQPLWVRADSVRFGQVLANLLGNAIKFTPTGGHIRVSAAAEGDTVLLSVSDDGVGIGAADVAGIFDLFRQEQSSRSHSAGGLGIGLSLVRRLVELHGGTIAVHSDGKGLGSTFTIRLPRAE